MSDEVIVLTGNKQQAILLLIGSVALVALSLIGALNGKVFGWFGVIFFGLGVLVSVYSLRPGAISLKIDKNGIEMKTLFKPMKLAWSDVKCFYVAQMRTGLTRTKMIGIEFSESYENRRAARISSSLTGAEGGLPNHFNRSAEEICELLNRSKQRWDSEPKDDYSSSSHTD